MANEYYLAEQGVDRLLNEDGSLLVQESFQTIFLEPGGDATFSVATTNGFWTTINGIPDVATDFVHGTHARSIKYRPANTDTTVKTSVISAKGTRISFWLYINALPTATASVVIGSGGFDSFQIRLTSTGVLQLWSSSAQLGSNGSTLATGQWHRISLALTIASTSVNRFELFKGGVADISVTNATLTDAAPTTFTAGNCNGDATLDIRLSDFYIDNATTLTDTGNIWVTAKRPNANGTTNGFTTQIGAGGSGYGTGHSPQVNERALSLTNGWSMIGVGAAVTEQYNIESAATGDISLTGATIIDYLGWISAKALVAAGASIIVNGISTAISLTTAEKIFTKIAGSAIYPAGTGADIGITTDSTLTTVSIYEAGVIVAYIPAVGINYTQTCNEAVVLVDTLVKTGGRVLNEVITAVDTRVRTVGRSLGEVITAVDTLTRTGGKGLNERVKVSDSAGAGEVLIDSYPDSNDSGAFSIRTGLAEGYGQSFTAASAGSLSKVTFRMEKVGTPTGNMVAKVYAHSGTYGTSSLPTSSALATSDVFDVSTFATSPTLTDFVFSGANQIPLTASTQYVVTVEYVGGDATNRPRIYLDSTSPTHGGNSVSSGTLPSYLAVNTRDAIFYIYTNEAGGGSLIKTTSRSLAEIVLLVDTLTKIGGKGLAEVVVLVDTFVGSKLVTVVFNEVVALVDTVTKTAGRSLTEALTLVDTLSRVISRAFAEVVTLVDVVNKTAARAYFEAVTLVDTLSKTGGKGLNETVALVDTIAKMGSRSLNEALALADTVTKTGGKGLTEVITIVDTVTRTMVRSLAEALILVDTLAKTVSRSLAEVVVLVDTFSGTKVTSAIFNEIVTLVDSVSKTAGRSLTEAIVLVDTLTRSIARSVSEVVTLVDRVVKTPGRSFSEAVVLVDSLTRTVGRSLAENVTIVDVVVKTASRSLQEALALADTVSRVASRSFTETLVLVDIVMRVTGRSLSEAVVLVDTVSKMASRSFNEALALVDSLVKTAGKSLSESVTTVDTLTRTIGRSLLEVLSLSDIFAYTKTEMVQPILGKGMAVLTTLRNLGVTLVTRRGKAPELVTKSEIVTLKTEDSDLSHTLTSQGKDPIVLE